MNSDFAFYHCRHRKTSHLLAHANEPSELAPAIKLTIAADSPLQGKIRPGMSVEVDVDLRTGASGD